MYRRYVKLDAVPGGEPVRIHISQGDMQSRRIEFGLFASCGELELPEDTVMTMRVRRPDGGEVEITGDRNNLAVVFWIPEQVASCAGAIPASVTAASGDERLTFEQVCFVCDKKEGE
jgi:hypothetical protein